MTKDRNSVGSVNGDLNKHFIATHKPPIITLSSYEDSGPEATISNTGRTSSSTPANTSGGAALDSSHNIQYDDDDEESNWVARNRKARRKLPPSYDKPILDPAQDAAAALPPSCPEFLPVLSSDGKVFLMTALKDERDREKRKSSSSSPGVPRRVSFNLVDEVFPVSQSEEHAEESLSSPTSTRCSRDMSANDRQVSNVSSGSKLTRNSQSNLEELVGAGVDGKSRDVTFEIGGETLEEGYQEGHFDDTHLAVTPAQTKEGHPVPAPRKISREVSTSIEMVPMASSQRVLSSPKHSRQDSRSDSSSIKESSLTDEQPMVGVSDEEFQEKYLGNIPSSKRRPLFGVSPAHTTTNTSLSKPQNAPPRYVIQCSSL